MQLLVFAIAVICNNRSVIYHQNFAPGESGELEFVTRKNLDRRNLNKPSFDINAYRGRTAPIETSVKEYSFSQNTFYLVRFLVLVVLSEGVLGMQEVLWERLMEVLQVEPSLEDVLRNSWLAA